MYAKKKYIILFASFIGDQSENSKYLLLIDNRHLALRKIEWGEKRNNKKISLIIVYVLPVIISNGISNLH